MFLAAFIIFAIGVIIAIVAIILNFSSAGKTTGEVHRLNSVSAWLKIIGVFILGIGFFFGPLGIPAFMLGGLLILIALILDFVAHSKSSGEPAELTLASAILIILSVIVLFIGYAIGVFSVAQIAGQSVGVDITDPQQVAQFIAANPELLV